MLLVFAIAMKALCVLVPAAAIATVFVRSSRSRESARGRWLVRVARWTWGAAAACLVLGAASLALSLWVGLGWQQRAEFLSPDGTSKAVVFTRHEAFFAQYELHCRLVCTDVDSGDVIADERVQGSPLVRHFWDCPEFQFAWRADQKGGELRYRVPSWHEDMKLTVP